MAECVEKEALLEVVNNLRLGRHLNKDAELNLMERAINNLPAADVVEVVRCKDCKYRSGLNGRPPYMFYICTCAQGLTGAVRENHFCYYGERRGDDATD